MYLTKKNLEYEKNSQNLIVKKKTQLYNEQGMDRCFTKEDIQVTNT